MDRRFDDGAVRLQESEEPPRVTHPVQIDEKLVSPVITEEYTLVKPMVGDVPFVPSGIIVKVNRFDEGDVHDIVVEVIHRDLRSMVARRPRWIGKDDVPFICRSGTGHLDESA
jgi:hypothetical protein